MKHNDGMHDLALLVVRSVLGGSIAAHGAQKLFGWFGGPGIDATSQFMDNLGFTPGDQYARLAALGEIGSGVMIFTGTGGPLGPAILLSVMTISGYSVHVPRGYWAQNGGFELNAMYALLALMLAVEDHGNFSIDRATGLRERHKPLFGWLALAAGAAGAAYVLSRRTPPPPSDAQQPQQQPSSEHGTIDAAQPATEPYTP